MLHKAPGSPAFLGPAGDQAAFAELANVFDGFFCEQNLLTAGTALSNDGTEPGLVELVGPWAGHASPAPEPVSRPERVSGAGTSLPSDSSSGGYLARTSSDSHGTDQEAKPNDGARAGRKARLTQEQRLERQRESNRRAQLRYRTRQQQGSQTLALRHAETRAALNAARAEAAVLAAEQAALEKLLLVRDRYVEVLRGDCCAGAGPVRPPCNFNEPGLSQAQLAFVHGFCYLDEHWTHGAVLAPEAAATFAAVDTAALLAAFRRTLGRFGELLARCESSSDREMSEEFKLSLIQGVSGTDAAALVLGPPARGPGWTDCCFFGCNGACVGSGGGVAESWEPPLLLRSRPARHSLARHGRHGARFLRPAQSSTVPPLPPTLTQRTFHWRVSHYLPGRLHEMWQLFNKQGTEDWFGVMVRAARRVFFCRGWTGWGLQGCGNAEGMAQHARGGLA